MEPRAKRPMRPVSINFLQNEPSTNHPGQVDADAEAAQQCCVL
jgi:hypothetical protein